jgi:hypothetical protein
MLCEVRSRTEQAVKDAEPLEAARARLVGLPDPPDPSDSLDLPASDLLEPDLPEPPGPAPSVELVELEAKLRTVVSRWIRQMEALGVAVKGLWLVDFDNGSGYYCWRWPEERLEWYHGYDEEHAERIRIQ